MALPEATLRSVPDIGTQHQYAHKNTFDDGDLTPGVVDQEFLITTVDAKNYLTNVYNLDLIISVGCRIKSHSAFT